MRTVFYLVVSCLLYAGQPPCFKFYSPNLKLPKRVGTQHNNRYYQMLLQVLASCMYHYASSFVVVLSLQLAMVPAILVVAIRSPPNYPFTRCDLCLKLICIFRC